MATRAKLFSQLAKSVDTSGTITSAGISSTVSLGATVYDSVGLLPTSGVNAGDQAFVSSTSRLYINSGVGWYNVAVINATPVITSITDSDGLSGPFSLSNEGLDTTITIVATDSDTTDTVTYSATADSGFNGMATVSQSGDTFTISPFSSDSATTQSGTLTFKATDGINIANSIQTFTLEFLSPYWDEVSLNVGTLSTNSLDNSTFIDRSSNTYTVTPSGSPAQTAFHPYLDNWSVECDGTTDWLAVSSSADFAVGTGDFTVEAWVWSDNNRTTYGPGSICDLRTGPLNEAFAWRIKDDLGLRFADTQGGGTPYDTTTNVFIMNAWNHVALVRNSGTLTQYVNGVSVASDTVTTNYGTSGWPLRIGGNQSSGYELDGYISNFRFVKGTAVYTGNFTPPTENLTAVSGTSILACQSNRFVDNSGNGHTFTTSGTPTVSAYNPFGQGSEYASGANKGSYYNSVGTSGYLQRSNVAFGTGNFTIQFWFYMTAAFTDNRNFFGQSNGGGSTPKMLCYVISSNLRFEFGSLGGTALNYASSNFTTNQWYHIAYVREGTGTNELKMYVNGTQVATGQLGDTSTCTGNFRIGQVGESESYFADDFFQGYISDFYVSKTAEYTANFTLPTSPVGNTNADTYLPMDNAGIYDKTGNPNLITVSSGTGGTPSANTTYTKYAAASIYFPGGGSRTSGPHLRLPSKFASFGATNWTHEFWMYVDSLPSSVNQGIAGNNNANNYMSEFRLVLRTDGKLDFNAAHSSGSYDLADITSSTAISAQTWTHVAVVRNGANITLYIDGTNVGNAGIGSATAVLGRNGAATPFLIGKHCDDMLAFANDEAYFNGYIENYQIFQNFAKYTGNFTAPTSTQGRSYQAGT